MKPFNLEIKNPEPIVKDLRNHFSNNIHTQQVYLRLSEQQEYEKSSSHTEQRNAFGMSEELLPQILHAFGIRSMILNQPHDLQPLISLSTTILDQKIYDKRKLLKLNPLVQELQELFKKSQTIAFDEWSGFNSASVLWPGLLEEIIAPLDKKDLEFIFYMGDPTDKFSFQVEDALEIISRFSRRGEVTLAIDESEALSLWRILNGVGKNIFLGTQTIGDLKKKYFSLFCALDISRLLIYSTNSAILFSADEQFVLSRKPVDSKIELGNNARENFICGYSAGLLIFGKVPHSIAMGLIIFGASGLNNNMPDLVAVKEYIDEWIEDFEKPDAIFLYQ